MKNHMPLIILCAMLLLLCFSWSTVLDYDKNKLAEYEQHIQLGDKLKSKEIYIDAVSEYEMALALQPNNYDLAMEIVDIYKELEKVESYVKALKNAIAADSTKAEPYNLLIVHYMEDGNYQEAYDIIKKGEEYIPDNEQFQEYLLELKKEFYLTTIDDDEITVLYYYDGLGASYSRVQRDGKYGLLNPTGSISYSCIYDDIGVMVDKLMPVKKNGEYYFVDEQMYRKLVPDVTVEYFGSFGSGYAPAKYKGKYGYVNKSLAQCIIGGEGGTVSAEDGKYIYNFDLDYAGCFSNGAAAVQKNGKWAILGSSLGYLTEFEFDEIVLDEYGFCSRNNRIFVKKSNGYYMYNCEGTEISGPYEDVKQFASEEPAAVKKNGKWGFVSQSGEMIIEPKFSDADSFSCGYAPYSDGNQWGFIGEDAETLIEPQFEELHPFSSGGKALAKIDGAYKFVSIRLYE